MWNGIECAQNTGKKVFEAENGDLSDLTFADALLFLLQLCQVKDEIQVCCRHGKETLKSLLYGMST